MVELRLDSFDDSRMPRDCYVSVRVGDTQKLSRLSASRMYKFPNAGDRRYGKIEVFTRIGACSIDVDPTNADLRDVAIDCSEAGFGKLGLKVAVAGEGPVSKPADESGGKKEGGKVKAAKEYLSKHGLEVRLSEAMQAVLRERPDDPAEFLAAKLLGTNPKAGVKLPPVSGPPQRQEAAAMPGQRRLSSEPGEAERAQPQAQVQARPPRLEPLAKPVMPPAEEPAAGRKAAPPAGPTASQPSVLPFKDFYAANFRGIGEDALSKCWSKFPSRVIKPATEAATTAAKSVAPGGQIVGAVPAAHLKPSVGTWLSAAPLKRAPPAAAAPASAPAAGFRHAPSVGTWLQPRLQPPQAPAAEPETPEVPFHLAPSVGTWLQPLPLGVTAAVTPAVPFHRRPSVGTWLTNILVESVPEEAQAACAAAAPGAGSWVHKPSVGTWLAAPAPVEPPRVDAEPAMLMSNMARCGPSFPFLGLSNTMMLI
mmetsp:Transcript_50104/g.143261  ORF Transcript_50104/g.143261 Transcript_50104/m.143261 type:complete len:479 (+) Transcript_50104:68-1504(+)